MLIFLLGDVLPLSFALFLMGQSLLELGRLELKLVHLEA